MKVIVSVRHVDRLYKEPVIVPVFADQRPLARSAGRLDWRLQGVLSRMVLEEILGPGPPFLLAREPGRAFPAVMVYWAGDFKKLDRLAVAGWMRRASMSMANAGARTFSMAVWDLFGEDSSMQEFASTMMEGLWLGLKGFEKGYMKAVRLIWEPQSADLLVQDLQRVLRRHSSIEDWAISRE